MIQATKTTFQNWKDKTLHFYKKYEHHLEVAFFIGGFVIDAVFVSDVDELFAIVQQGIYLFLIAVLINYEILYRLRKWRPSARWKQAWKFRNLFLHFLLGTLLNIYSIFYIKSASFFGSLIFLAVMLAIVLANELPIFKNSNVSLKVALYSICLFSFVSIMYPLAIGWIGWFPIIMSILTTVGLFYWQAHWLKKKIGNEMTILKVIGVPAGGVVFVFLVFYYFGWIPPVPLSIKEQGIYHMIERKQGHYLLSMQKEWWKFWQSGDQEFLAQPGDKIYYYVQIFSPTHFSDDVFVHWYFKDHKRGWQKRDRIPLKIVGGRRAGFRGFTTKSNYEPGEWRVQVETLTGQEISRLYFEVIPDNEVGRTLTILQR